MLSYYQITTKMIALAIQIILLIIFQLSGNFCFLLLYLTNSVEEGQPGPDLDPDYLALWWYFRGYFLKNYFKIVHFQKCHTQKACIITKELIWMPVPNYPGRKKPEQINNPEQSAPRGAVWSRLSDCFLQHSWSAGRFHFRSHTLKELFL